MKIKIRVIKIERQWLLGYRTTCEPLSSCSGSGFPSCLKKRSQNSKDVFQSQRRCYVYVFQRRCYNSKTFLKLKDFVDSNEMLLEVARVRNSRSNFSFNYHPIHDNRYNSIMFTLNTLRCCITIFTALHFYAQYIFFFISQTLLWTSGPVGA